MTLILGTLFLFTLIIVHPKSRHTRLGVRIARADRHEEAAAHTARTQIGVTRFLAILASFSMTAAYFLPARADTPLWSACREACDKEYDEDIEQCKGKGMEAVCRERAMNKYSKCLAKCPPEDSPCPKSPCE